MVIASGEVGELLFYYREARLKARIFSLWSSTSWRRNYNKRVSDFLLSSRLLSVILLRWLEIMYDSRSFRIESRIALSRLGGIFRK